MNFVKVISLIIICITAKGSASKVPGSSACLYFGSIKEICGLPTVPVSSLPTKCTSFIWTDIIVDDEFNIADGSDSAGNAEHLKDLLESGKPVIEYYGHITLEKWAQALSSNSQDGGVKAKKEMESLKTYLDQNIGITGLILENLGLESNSKGYPNLTANLQVYLQEMRTQFPDLGIGIELLGSSVIEFYDSPKVEWLDFKTLDPLVDFFVLNLLFFNDCTAQFQESGTTPLTGDAPYTLEKLVNYVTKAGIPKSKVYFVFRTGPESTNPGYGVCDTHNEKFCKSPSPDGWCSDDTRSYNEKGNYAKNNGAGFIAANVDFDDPNSCCGCGHPFPAFYDLLDGFNGVTTSKPCSLLDK